VGPLPLLRRQAPAEGRCSTATATAVATFRKEDLHKEAIRIYTSDNLPDYTLAYIRLPLRILDGRYLSHLQQEWNRFQ